MTDQTRLVALVEGFPQGTPPNMIWRAAWLRRDKTRSELRALSTSIFAGVSIAIGGGNTAEISKPFYTTSEWEAMTQEAEDARQAAAQAAQIAKLRRMSETWGR